MSRGGSRDLAQERWVKRVRRGVPGEVVNSRGILHGGGCSIEYYTSQPSSTQWIALGVVPLLPGIDQADATHRVMVGTGDSEQAAIASLKSRLDDLFSNQQAMPLAEPANLELQPSDWFG